MNKCHSWPLFVVEEVKVKKCVHLKKLLKFHWGESGKGISNSLLPFSLGCNVHSWPPKGCKCMYLMAEKMRYSVDLCLLVDGKAGRHWKVEGKFCI